MSKPNAREDLSFYQEQSEISSPGRYESLFAGLPTGIHELARVVQGLLLHQFWILDEKNYGITAETLKASGRNLNDEINLRSVEEILDLAVQWDDRPLTAPRVLEKRVVGNCRDYSVLLVSLLRHQGVPARVRSGVARYLLPQEGHLEDHFICEYWNTGEQRWQRADGQIDAVQRKALGISMDMTDLPPNQFLDGAESYAELTEGRVAPDKTGIFDSKGEVYVHYKLISDLACVNSVEVLPWEGWGICEELGALSEEDLELLEEIAGILAEMRAGTSGWREARKLFETHPKLKIPEGYRPHYFELPAFND